MNKFLIFLKILIAIFACLTLLLWLMIHGTSHNIPLSTEIAYGISLIILDLLFAVVDLFIKRLKAKHSEDV